MPPLYILLHDYEADGGYDELTYIGVYSSVEKVEAAIAALRAQPGFVDHPDDFLHFEAVPDFTNWQDGFVRLAGDEIPKDVPSWAGGSPPRAGETGKDFARRLMDGRHGPGKWSETDGEYRQLQKWGDRALQAPADRR